MILVDLLFKVYNFGWCSVIFIYSNTHNVSLVSHLFNEFDKILYR